MDLARIVLDYLRVLVWPLLILAGLLVLRVPLRSKLADVLRLRLPGAEVEFAHAIRRLEENVADSAAYLATPPAPTPTPPSPWRTPLHSPGASGDRLDDEDAQHDMPAYPDYREQGYGGQAGAAAPSGATAPSGPPSERGLPDPVPMDPWQPGLTTEEALRRSAVEAVMRDAAGWGYELARMGYRERPVPVVEWSPDGRPHVTYDPGTR